MNPAVPARINEVADLVDTTAVELDAINDSSPSCRSSVPCLLSTAWGSGET